MFKIKLMFMGLVVLLVFSVGSAWAQVANGHAAPDFTLTDSNGHKHSLSDYKGKFVVLEWFNPDCPFVKKHYNSANIPNLQKKYTAKGVVWLAINSSAPGQQGSYTPKEFNKFMKQNKGMPTAVLLDPEGKVGRLYDAQTTPSMFVIDSKGNLAYQGAIDSIASTDMQDIAKAQNYVSESLDAAMNGKSVAFPVTKSYGCSVKYKT